MPSKKHTGQSSASAGKATQDGIEFGPTANNKLYLSLFYHRGNPGNSNKSIWTDEIKPYDEYLIFVKADDEEWFDDSGHYWGMRDGGIVVLGKHGERLCKFPHNRKQTVPWHGYPVSPLERGEDDSPPDELADKWLELGAISRVIHRRILRRKI
jgi:hypothetical protein